jgi:hypothetical protein
LRISRKEYEAWETWAVSIADLSQIFALTTPGVLFHQEVTQGTPLFSILSDQTGETPSHSANHVEE